MIYTYLHTLSLYDALPIYRHAQADGLCPTAIEGLSFFRSSQPSELTFGVYRPSLALLVQGAKRVEVGEDVYEYSASHYLLTSIDLPVADRKSTRLNSSH